MKNIEFLSSSCMIKCSLMKKWSINIGDRQKGRVRANSVFDVEVNEQKITEKSSFLLKKNLAIPPTDFRNPYSKKDTIKNIYKILKSINTENIFKKKIYDIDFKPN